jgi:hypothetical protein
MCSMLTFKSNNRNEFDSDDIEPFTNETFNSNYLGQMLYRCLSSANKSFIRKNPSNNAFLDNIELFEECPMDLNERTKLETNVTIKVANHILI